MAEETEFAMGATASCVDGPGGRVSRVVIEPKHRLGVGRLVPLDLVDTTAGDIRLRCTVEEFGNLEPAQETEVLDDFTGMRLGGMSESMGVRSPMPVILQNVVPLGEADVDRGDPV